jgi:hypothetical protein
VRASHDEQYNPDTSTEVKNGMLIISEDILHEVKNL